MYLENPAKAIAEMARVTRSGGHVIIFDFDHRAFFIDSDFVPMTRHIEAMLADEPRNPLIGRELPHLMRGCKLKIDTIEQTTLIPTLAIARRIYAASRKASGPSCSGHQMSRRGGRSKRRGSEREPSIIRIPAILLWHQGCSASRGGVPMFPRSVTGCRCRRAMTGRLKRSCLVVSVEHVLCSVSQICGTREQRGVNDGACTCH